MQRREERTLPAHENAGVVAVFATGADSAPRPGWWLLRRSSVASADARAPRDREAGCAGWFPTLTWKAGREIPSRVPPPAGTLPPGLPPEGGVSGSTLKSPQPAPAPGPAIAATLPSNRRCVSRRSSKIRLARPAGDPLAKAEVRVNGRKVQVVKKSRLTAPVDLRGLPKGKVKVSITAITRSGRRLTASRTYKTCAARKHH